MSKVLVTGFKPFLGEKINPSEILLEFIKKDFAFHADTLLLPVSFQSAFPLLQKHLQKEKYKAVLLLGQAGGRSKISLERVALNWIETESPDEDGHAPPRGVIEKDEASALFTLAPVNEWKDILTSKGVPAEVSLSAGGYVCNHTYFHTLKHLSAHRQGTPACFIHVPYLPEQVAGKSATTPSMELELMQKALAGILDHIIS